MNFKDCSFYKLIKIIFYISLLNTYNKQSLVNNVYLTAKHYT